MSTQFKRFASSRVVEGLALRCHSNRFEESKRGANSRGKYPEDEKIIGI